MSRKQQQRSADILTAPGADTFEIPEERAEPSLAADLDTVPPKEEWTVNGIAVANMPAQLQAAIVYSITDQAIAQRQAKPGPRAVVEFLADPSDKRLQQYEDLDDDIDPMQEIVNRHQQPGKHYRFLSPEHRAGRRAFEIVKDDKNEPVKYRGMILGEVPVDRKKARDRKVLKRSEENLRNTVESMRVDQERAIRDDRRGGMSLLRDGDVLTDADSPNRSASIGVSLTRGTGADAA